jgi:hypothetical protein
VFLVALHVKLTGAAHDVCIVPLSRKPIPHSSVTRKAMTQEAQKELRKLTGMTLCVMLARAAADAEGDAKPAEVSGPASAVADLLQIAPHAVPYALRVDMFRQLLRMDKERISARRGGRQVTVRRGSVLEDACKQLAPLGAAIKEPFMVVFVDEHGAQEAGVLSGFIALQAC